LKVLGVLPTMYDSRTKLARATLADVEDRYGLAVLETADHEVREIRGGALRWPQRLVHRQQFQGAEAYRKIAAS
jgi:chromosome partitioning protein